jgi:WS/DGAT/MGAT family acyltransferase
MTTQLEAHVRDTDAFTFRMERDPLLRSTIVAVSLLDRSPDWDVLVERVERATLLAPSFREKVVAAPFGLAPPRWVIDHDFDLRWHLRRVGAPPPHDVAVVLEMARIAGMTAFDQARPMWEITLVDGLEGGQAALVMKVHHSLTDGLGGIQLAAHVVDLDRTPADLGPLPPVPDAPFHGAAEQLGEAIGFDLARSRDVARSVLGAVPDVAARLWRAPRDVVVEVGSTAASLARMVRPVTSTLSPVMTERRLQWRYQSLDVPLDDLKLAAKQVDGTVNDAFLAAVAGGLSRYHHRHGVPVERLRVTMPISIRRPDDPEGGNRISLVRFVLPTGVLDPLERMRSMGRIAAEQRRERALPLSNTIAGILNLLPVSVTGGMLKHIDFLASNVPGFADPVYIGGARVESFRAFGPTIGAAANVTLMSYRGTCHLGITTDVGAVPDADSFLECLEAGFDEIVEAGRAPS